MIRRPPRSTPLYSSAASDVYKRQTLHQLRQCLHSGLIGDSDADNLRPGCSQGPNLPQRRLHVMRPGIGHGLNNERRAATEMNTPQLYSTLTEHCTFPSPSTARIMGQSHLRAAGPHRCPWLLQPGTGICLLYTSDAADE